MITRDDQGAALVLACMMGVRLEAPYSGFVIADGRGPSGALVLNNYDGNNVHLTLANNRPMGIRVAREIARMCFVNLGCVRITARTRRSNVRAHLGLERVGFKLEGIARQHFRDEDALLYGLLRDEQRLIRIEP